jgi:hypothetical protein
MYVGTDVGVFYKKDSDITWQYYGTGMPNTQVSDLEIYYPTGKLRAGSYGRGIWENDIARHITPLNVGQVKVGLSSIQLIQNPVNAELHLQLEMSDSQDLLFEIFDAVGRKIKSYNSYAIKGQSTLHLDATMLSTGNYIMKIVSEKGLIQSFKFSKL